MSPDAALTTGTTPTFAERLRRDAQYVAPSLLLLVLSRSLFGMTSGPLYAAAGLVGWIVGCALEGRAGGQSLGFVPARVAVPLLTGWLLVSSLASKIMPTWAFGLLGAAMIISAGLVAARYTSRG